MRTIIASFLLLPLYAAAQTWAPIGAKWTYSQHFVTGPDSSLYILECVTDSLIQGHTCSVLQGNFNGCFFPGSGRAFTYASGDSVFLFDEERQDFGLLYAFNAQPGDSWDLPRHIWTPNDTVRFEVNAISTTTVDGQTLRVLDLTSTVIYGDDIGPMWPLPAMVTERLGSNIYPFLWGHEACDMDVIGPLRCYEESTLPMPEPPPPLPIQWLNPRYPQCALTEPVPAAIRFDEPLGSWFVADTYPEGSINDPNFVRTRTTRYFFSGSTTIDGHTWNRLHAMDTWTGIAPVAYQGSVRQVDQLVLFMDTMGTIDTLYNFGVQVGDSVRYPDFGAPSPYLTVEAIDTIIIQDHPHRRYHFSEYIQSLEDVFTDTWIEGIGSIHGPLAPRIPSALGYHYSFPDSTRTTCYLHWDDPVWRHPGYTHCTTNILAGVDERDAARITLRPNPATDAVYVYGLPPQGWNYHILDMTGRVHATGTTTGGDPHRIDLHALPAGVYLLRAKEAGTRSFRIVKE